MKKITTQEIRDLFNRVMIGEISFSIMVEILNERVSEAEVSEFKDGDFVVNEVGDVLIFKKKEGDLIYDHAYLQKGGILLIEPNLETTFSIKRHATEEEKQKMLDAIAKEGKRWNEEKKCVEDIPVRKFKLGDKVRIKHGVSSKTHYKINPAFVEEMDKLIGKELIVENCSKGGFVKCDGYYFSENWLEPYEELKKGDLVIFWDSYQAKARIGVYNQLYYSSPFPHEDHIGNRFRNAIKFESEKQFKRLINGGI